MYSHVPGPRDEGIPTVRGSQGCDAGVSWACISSVGTWFPSDETKVHPWPSHSPFLVWFCWERKTQCPLGNRLWVAYISTQRPCLLLEPQPHTASVTTKWLLWLPVSSDSGTIFTLGSRQELVLWVVPGGFHHRAWYGNPSCVCLRSGRRALS